MSTQFTNRQWRLPNNENKDKQSNYSMDFDGSQYISCGTDSVFELQVLSLSCWFKEVDTSNTGTRAFIANKNYSSDNGVALWIADGTDLVFQIAAQSDNTSFIDSRVASFRTYAPIGTWSHAVCTYDGTDAKIYINGVLRNTWTPTQPYTVYYSPTYTELRLGNRADGTNTPFIGQIDGVSIFNYALTDGTGGTVNQIAALYGSSSTGIGNPMSLSPAPVAYYPLGDQDAFNGADYLVPNSSLKDYVFDFNNSQEINCGNDSSLQMDTVFTMSCWINTTSTSRGSIMGTFISNGYYIDLMASGTVQGGYHSTDSHFLRPSSSTVNDGNWHHICYVISGTATGDLDVYVDGQLDNGSFTSSGTPSGAVTTNPFKINLQGYAGRYTGKTSNVQVFNTALPATGSNSVETLYNNGSPLTSMSGFTSLQGWWKLDASATYDGTDWSIPDDSSNSNTGTSSGMTQSALQQSDLSFKTSYSPYALNFDGANDYIDTNFTIPAISTYSFSLWFKTPSAPVGNSSILSDMNSNGQNLSGRGHVGFYNNFFSSSMGNGTNYWYDISSYNISSFYDNNWHNIVLTINNYTQKLYIDGSLVHTYDTSTGGGGASSAVSAGTAGTQTYKIARAGDFNGNYFNGSISNVSIWNAALTSSQVTEIYSEGIPQNLNNHSAYSNLVSWWQLGSNSSFNTNWTVLDEKGSNNGTSVNMTEADIVDGVGSYANGLSSGMGGDEIVGDAFGSSANSLSVNMDVLDRTTDTPS